MKTEEVIKKENKFISIIKSEYKRFFIITFASIVYSLGLAWFLQPGKVYSGGVVGLVQLILDIIEKFTGETHTVGLLIFILNAPLLIIAFKSVSIKFAIYSLISIVIQTIMGLGFIELINLEINIIGNPEYNRVLLSIIGGGLVGFGGAIALRCGGSTGGIDILAQALALKKNLSIGVSCLIFNVCIALVGGFILGSWAIVFYTIIRIITTSVVTDKIHTIYNHLKVEIITDNGEEMSNMIMSVTGRGVTVLSGEGAYTHRSKYVLEVVLSSFQLYQITNKAKEIDGHVFIIASPVKSIVGNFKKKTIA